MFSRSKSRVRAALGLLALALPLSAATAQGGARMSRAGSTSFSASDLVLQPTPGCTWNFQGWYRDPGDPSGTEFNLSDGLSVTSAP